MAFLTHCQQVGTLRSDEFRTAPHANFEIAALEGDPRYANSSEKIICLFSAYSVFPQDEKHWVAEADGSITYSNRCTSTSSSRPTTFGTQ